MYSLEEIQSIVTGVIKLRKPYDQRTANGGKIPWKDVPEYWPGYKQAVKLANSIKVHAEIGEFPDELFLVRAPNQTEKEFEYIKANYKQNTLPVFMDYIATMSRPYFDGNWSIDYQTEKYDDTENTLQAYVESEITPVGTLESYMKNMVTQLAAVDANGVIAVKPKVIPATTNENGEAVVDNTQMFEPVPIFYCTEKKLAFEAGKYYLILTDEKSPVTYGGKTLMKGHVFEFYDDTNIWRIIQTGTFTDYRFEYVLYMAHDWQRVPVKELEGVPQPVEGSDKTIWISPFQYAVPSLNSALILTQYQQASIAKCVFPYPVMVGRVCEFEYKDKSGSVSPCMAGKVYDTVLGVHIDCPNCHGTGLLDRLSPMGQMLLNPDSDFNKGDANLGQKALYFVEPGTGALDFVEKKISTDFENARKMLHQQTSNSIVKGSEDLTATGMALDHKAMYAFVKTPSGQRFAMWEFILDAIGYMRYGEGYYKVMLVEPQTFDYLTDEDYLRQISAAQEANLPPFIIHSILEKYLMTLYYNEKQRADVFGLVINTDRLLVLKQDDILLKFSRGLVQDWEITLHDSAIILIGDLISANQNFFEQDFETQQAALIDAAKAATVKKPTAQETAIQAALA